jgi:hypothetical protein
MLPGERVLLESNTKTLTLTSHRVRYRVTRWGSTKVISIMLDQVASCGLVRASHPTLLIVAAICGVALFLADTETRGGFLLIGILLVFAYFITRRTVLAIASSGHTILAPTAGMSVDAIEEFIDQTESAKDARYLSRPRAG